MQVVSYIGDDFIGEMIKGEFFKSDIRTDYIFNNLDKSLQSVVLYDNDGVRKIYCDLKDVQDRRIEVSQKLESLVIDCDLAVICNTNFTRPLL